MPVPNMINITSMTGFTSAVSVSATSVILVENPAGSNSSYKINSLFVSNVGTSANQITVDFYRTGQIPGGPQFSIVKSVNVPAQTTLDLISNSVYLMENDSLRAYALSADGGAGVKAICSFEIIK